MDSSDTSKNKASVVWRNQDGIIACPGDDCPQKCDDTCPIWCQTMALTMMNMGQFVKAVTEYEKAVKLAPDFKEAWVNLGAAYGYCNCHSEAERAYKAAYDLDNNYKNAIYGLIIAYKNETQYEQALKYCDEYAQKIDKSEADKLREEILALQKTAEAARQDDPLEMALKIIERARQDGILTCNEQPPYIPEIIAEGQRACQKIHDELITDKDGRSPVIWLSWGAYAGMGAVYHWSKDWNSLKSKGVAETLLEPRGYFAMDEYVLDAIGVTYESPEGKKLSNYIRILANWAFVEFMKDATEDNAMQIIMHEMQAMYHFGMVYEMDRLGMK